MLLGGNTIDLIGSIGVEDNHLMIAIDEAAPMACRLAVCY